MKIVLIYVVRRKGVTGLGITRALLTRLDYFMTKCCNGVFTIYFQWKWTCLVATGWLCGFLKIDFHHIFSRYPSIRPPSYVDI